MSTAWSGSEGRCLCVSFLPRQTSSDSNRYACSATRVQILSVRDLLDRQDENHRSRPELEGKSLTKRVVKSIQQHFEDLFGEYAGWAHNVLFVAELSSHQRYLPEKLRTQTKSRKRSRQKSSNGITESDNVSQLSTPRDIDSIKDLPPYHVAR